MRTKLIAFLILLSLAPCIRTFAQQDPQYSLHMFNPLVINPAYAGSRDALSAVLLARQQWTGFTGAPSTQSVSVNSPLQNKKMGVGLHIVNDIIGPKRDLSVNGSYAYRIQTKKGKLSFGLRASVHSFRFAWDDLEYRSSTDAAAGYSTVNKTTFSTDFGMHYYTSTYYGGVCISHLNRPKYSPALSSVDGSRLVPHILLTGGYVFELNEKIAVKPYALIISTRAKTMIDLNGAILFDKKFWVGIGYRPFIGTSLLMEYNITKNFRAGYCYDRQMNRLRTASASSHELFLGFDLPSRTSGKSYSLRYF